MYILFSIMIIIITLLLIGILVFKYKYEKLQDELYTLKRDGYRNNNKYSMIEYYIRGYKEGNNAYTTMRDIQNIIYKE